MDLDKPDRLTSAVIARLLEIGGGLDQPAFCSTRRTLHLQTGRLLLHNLQREERRAERYVDRGLPLFEPRPVI